ncbi:hypothetical protein NQ317_004007 [Molorchus minor]|uniref:Uncharacterized protein n=1 Tax=Molorchus minor TaxID=1323400 RepID=A0ABQ9JSP9_9CUCU|nr:hypothetical protein NQ317_004007 [Molorchus minor]
MAPQATVGIFLLAFRSAHRILISISPVVTWFLDHITLMDRLKLKTEDVAAAASYVHLSALLEVYFNLNDESTSRFFLLKSSENARILATVFSPAYSHQTAFRPLWKELLKRGHEITLLTTDPMNETNLPGIREIDLSKSYDVMEQFGASDIVANGQSSGKSVKELFDAYIKALSETAKWQLGHPEVKALIQNKSEYFDLIMTEVMFPAHLGFVDRFRVPFIGITSLDSPPRIHDAIGNFIHPVVYPDYILPFSKNLTFPQRLISTIVSWFLSIYEYYMYQTEYETARRYFGDYVRPSRK